MMRSVGIHLRIDHTLAATAQRAQALGASCFQCFASLHTSGASFTPTENDIAAFKTQHEQFNHIFLHATYYINPASCTRSRHPLLDREIELAKQLHAPYLVVHPGSATGAVDVTQGIHALARVINRVHQQQSDVTIVLENTAHNKLSVGSNFEHLHQLLLLLDEPDRIRFCLDTAHAYAFGYDISDPTLHNSFIDLIDQTIGIERIVLIHLNDTKQPLKSYIDRHCMLGAGLIGTGALQALATHERLRHIPLVLELPVISDTEYSKVVKMVQNW